MYKFIFYISRTMIKSWISKKMRYSTCTSKENTFFNKIFDFNWNIIPFGSCCKKNIRTVKVILFINFTGERNKICDVGDKKMGLPIINSKNCSYFTRIFDAIKEKNYILIRVLQPGSNRSMGPGAGY